MQPVTHKEGTRLFHNVRTSFHPHLHLLSAKEATMAPSQRGHYLTQQAGRATGRLVVIANKTSSPDSCHTTSNKKNQKNHQIYSTHNPRHKSSLFQCTGQQQTTPLNVAYSNYPSLTFWWVSVVFVVFARPVNGEVSTRLEGC